MAHASLQTIFACFGCTDSAIPNSTSYPDEKQALISAYQSRPDPQIAEDVVSTILSSKLTGAALRMKLDAIVGATGWTENLAKGILEKLSLALQQAHDNLGPAVRNAYHKAWEVAKDIEGFVVEHPVVCTIVALGVLVSYLITFL